MKFVVRFLMRALALLPLGVHYALGRFLAWLACDVFRYRRRDVLINLARSFPDKDYKEIKRISRQFYRHFGDVIAETVWFGGSSAKRLHRQHLVEFEGLEEMTRMHEKAPDIVVLMSHAGNWELYGGFASYNYSGRPMPFDESNVCIVYLRQSSKMWDWILRANRLAPYIDAKGYEGYLESRQVLRYALTHKGEHKVYNFITDQYPYFAGGTLNVRFMNQDTVTMKGAADLARKMGAAVFFLSERVENRGAYKFRYVPICEDASSLSSLQIMTEYYRLLEEDLKAQPWNYLWTHRRWKIINQ